MEEPLQISLDGEPMTNTRFRFEVLPRRLPIKLPPDCPLLAGPREQEIPIPNPAEPARELQHITPSE